MKTTALAETQPAAPAQGKTTTAAPDRHDAQEAFDADMDGLFGEVTGEEAGDDDEDQEQEAPVVVKPKVEKATKPDPKAKAPVAEEETTSEDENETDDEDDEAAEAAEEEDALKGARDKERVQAILDKRREKLTKAREAREAAISERDKALERIAELETGDGPAPVLLTPTAGNPLSDIHSTEVLAQKEAAAKSARDWCRKNRTGGSINGRELDADEVARMEDDATALLDAIPARRKWLADWKADVDTAVKTLPFLNPSHPLHPQLAAFGDERLSATPQIAASPTHVSDIARLFAFSLIEAGTHQLIRRADGTRVLVSIASNTNGNGKGAQQETRPADKAKPATRPAAPAPPVRRDSPQARLEDRKASKDPQEAFDADMEEFLTPSFR